MFTLSSLSKYISYVLCAEPKLVVEGLKHELIRLFLELYFVYSILWQPLNSKSALACR